LVSSRSWRTRMRGFAQPLKVDASARAVEQQPSHIQTDFGNEYAMGVSLNVT
jgi:hypothetical protein